MAREIKEKKIFTKAEPQEIQINRGGKKKKKKNPSRKKKKSPTQNQESKWHCTSQQQHCT